MANSSPKNVEPPLSQPGSGQVTPQQNIWSVTKNHRNDFSTEDTDPFKEEIVRALPGDMEQIPTPVSPLAFKPKVTQSTVTPSPRPAEDFSEIEPAPTRKPEIVEPTRADTSYLSPDESKGTAKPFLLEKQSLNEVLPPKKRGTVGPVHAESGALLPAEPQQSIQPSPEMLVPNDTRKVNPRKQQDESAAEIKGNPSTRRVLSESLGSTFIKEIKTDQINPQVPLFTTNTRVPAAEQKAVQPSPFLPQKDIQNQERPAKVIQPDKTERPSILPLPPMPPTTPGNTESRARLVIGELKVEVVHATPVEQVKTPPPEIRIVKTPPPAPARNTGGSGLKVQFGLGQI